jgi:hypothetical protein
MGNIKKDAEIKAKKAIKAAEEKFNHVKKTVHNGIKKDPEKAVLIAAAVGAAIGAIAMMMLNKKKKE